MSDQKPKRAEVEALYAELSDLEKWVNPKSDPAVWPPEGWQPHPTAPGWYCRMLTEDALREEIFGSEQKREWLKWAAGRMEQIKERLAKYFFPKAKEEGVQRIEKSGFVAMFTPSLTRKFDVPALASVVAACQEIAAKKKIDINVEAKAIDWVPKLKLSAYREMPDVIRKQFDAALIITPGKPVFEIVRVGESSAEETELEEAAE